LVSVVGARGAKLQFTLSQNFEAASIGTWGWVICASGLRLWGLWCWPASNRWCLHQSSSLFFKIWIYILQHIQRSTEVTHRTT
jgi:hypothetical protein